MSLCDRGGNFLDAIVLPANWDERVCALALLLQVKHKPWWRQVKVVYADSGFSGEGFGRQIEQQCGVRLDIVNRIQAKGFEVLPNRWLIEAGSSSRSLVAREDTAEPAVTTSKAPAAPAPRSRVPTSTGG